jgi:hypothetical protein
MVKTPLRAVVVGLIAVSAVYRVGDSPAAFDAFRSLATLLSERRAKTAEISVFERAGATSDSVISAVRAKANADG